MLSDILEVPKLKVQIKISFYVGKNLALKNICIFSF